MDDEEIAEAKRTSTPEAFSQEWEANFISYGGLVFPEFTNELHVRSHIFNPFLETQLWVDPGTAAPYCVLLVQITPDEHINVLGEIYRTGRTSADIIDEAQDPEKWGSYILDAYGRPKQDLVVTIDKAAAEAAGTWRANGYNAGGEKPTIKKGIEVHHNFLIDPYQSDENSLVPKLTFDPTCTNAIKEYGTYHYPDEIRKRIETNPTEVPVDVDNHAMDAIRYGLYNKWPELFNEERKHTEVEYMDLEEVDPGIGARVSLGDY